MNRVAWLGALLAVVAVGLRAEPSAPLPDVALRGELAAAEQAAPEPVKLLIAQVRGESLPDRLAAMLKLRALGPDGAGAVLALAELLWGEAADTVVLDLPPTRLHQAEVAAYALAGLGQRAVGPLVLALASDSDLSHDWVLRALRGINPKWTSSDAARAEVPALMDQLTSPRSNVRSAATKALGLLGDSRALPRLALLLTSATEALDVRLAAAKAIAALDAPDVAARLADALTDPEPTLRLAVVDALSLRRPVPTEPLLRALADSEPQVRAAAVSALRYGQGTTVVNAVAQCLRDADKRVREMAAVSLGDLRDSTALDPLLAALADPVRSVKEEVLFALARLGDKRAVPKLIFTAQDEDPRIRELSARALGRFRERAGLETLVLLLDDEPNVALAALASLEGISGQKLGKTRAAWEAWLKNQR
ncbi:MAG: HEAT repeat domain-containing protein [Armatimonadetes bacterium]|nr:HEAT repeat domain-containing protein [Armatimonadota bacterium]